MNCLLDTPVFLWMLADPGRLSAPARQAIQHPDHTVFVSAVDFRGNRGQARLGEAGGPPPHLAREISSRGLVELPLHYAHGEALQDLPPHHQDPFDRMLIAQARHERLTLITHDRKFEPYGLPILWT